VGAAVAVAVAVASVATPAATAVARAAEPVPVQLVAINDFHGRISPTAGEESRLTTGPGADGKWGRNANGDSDDEVVKVGGAMNVASAVRRLQNSFRQRAGGSAASFFVSAGDIVGASPPVSADYRDEPSVEAANVMGLDVSAVGDDEFNRGTQELRRISAATDGQATDDVTACEGITKGKTGCFGEGRHAFRGAQYPYLAANVLDKVTRNPILPPYKILYTPTGVRIALIGVVTQNLPALVPAKGIADVTVIDEADAVNRWVPEIRSRGVEAIGVLVHEGAQREGPEALDPNGCEGVVGPITRINERIDPAVDFIVSGYTHQPYNCELPVPGGQPRLVTHAGAYGRLVTDIRLTLNPRSGDVNRRATYSAKNVPVTRTSPDARVQAIVDYWTAGPGNQPAAPSEPVRRSTSTAAVEREKGGLIGAVVLLIAFGLPLGVWLFVRRRTTRPG
jgi:5'-nucleotidase